MSKEKIKYDLIDNIMSYLKYTFLDILNEDENKEKLSVFYQVLEIMETMNKDYYSYTLKDIDDKLFDKLINEVISVLG